MRGLPHCVMRQGALLAWAWLWNMVGVPHRDHTTGRAGSTDMVVEALLNRLGREWLRVDLACVPMPPDNVNVRCVCKCVHSGVSAAGKVDQPVLHTSTLQASSTARATYTHSSSRTASNVTLL